MELKVGKVRGGAGRAGDGQLERGVEDERAYGGEAGAGKEAAGKRWKTGEKKRARNYAAAPLSVRVVAGGFFTSVKLTPEESVGRRRGSGEVRIEASLGREGAVEKDREIETQRWTGRRRPRQE